MFESQIPPLLSDDPRVSIGRFTYGSPSLRVWAPEDGIHIGSFCSIADGVVILGGGEHRSDWITTYPLRIALGHPLANADGHPATKGTTQIGHDVWIGHGAMILSGVSIGSGAIVAAGSVVSRSVAPYAVVAGNPARWVKSRFDDGQVAALLEIGWWNWPIDKIRGSLSKLCSANINAFIDEYRDRAAEHAIAGTREI